MISRDKNFRDKNGKIGGYNKIQIYLLSPQDSSGVDCALLDTSLNVSQTCRGHGQGATRNDQKMLALKIIQAYCIVNTNAILLLAGTIK